MTPSALPPLDALLEHEDFVHRLAKSLLADASSADDVVQETWLAALRARPRSDAPLRPWLARVARRFALMHRRAEGARSARERSVSRPERFTSAADVVAREEERQRLVRLVLALPPASREALLLRYFEGLPPRAIARQLGVGTETVKTRLKRGLAALRTRLEAEETGLQGLALLALGPGELTARATGVALAQPWKLATAAVTALGLLGAGLVVVLQRRTPSEASVASPDLAADAPKSRSESRAERSVVVVSSQAPAARGRIVERETGAPLGGLDVTATWAAGGTETVASDSGGRFTLDLDTTDTLLALEVAAGATSIPFAERVDRLLAPGDERDLVVAVSRGTVMHGSVVDAAGVRVPGAEVRGWCARRPEGPPLRTTRAGLDGEFSLPHLGRDVFVEASAPGLASLRVVRGRLRDVQEAEGFVLMVGAESVLSGMVRSESGAPIAAARVSATFRLEDPTPEPNLSYEDALSPRTESAGDGSFALPLVAARRVFLEVSAPGYLDRQEELAPTADTLEIRLAPAFTLRGRVVDASGAGVSGAEVCYRWRSILGRGTTDASGAFVLEGLEPWPWGLLGARAPGYAIGVRELVAVPQAQGAALELRLDPERALAGRVIWSGGSPAQGVTLRATGQRILGTARDGGVRGPSTAEWLFAAPVETTTDTDGRFAFHELGADTFLLEAQPPEGPVYARTFEVRSGNAALELVLDDTVEGVRIEGRVLDARTSTPVPEFTITVYRVEEGRHSKERTLSFAEPDGRFALPELRPGSLRLFVEAPDFKMTATDARDYDSGVHEESITLAPARSLLLRLATEDGAPLAGATVHFSARAGRLWIGSPDGGSVEAAISTDAGEVFAHGLPPEEIEVGIYAADRTRSWTRTFDLTLPVEGVVQLRLDPRGEPRPALR